MRVIFYYLFFFDETETGDGITDGQSRINEEKNKINRHEKINHEEDEEDGNHISYLRDWVKELGPLFMLAGIVVMACAVGFGMVFIRASIRDSGKSAALWTVRPFPQVEKK